MTAMRPEFTWDEKTGLPSFRKQWDGKVPEYEGIVTSDGTGKRPKRQLEFVMDIAIKKALLAGFEGMITTVWLAESCQAEDGFETSSSSVSSVFQRWEKLGYVEVDKKRPMRFITYTAKGMELGLPEMYRREKRAKRQAWKGWDT